MKYFSINETEPGSGGAAWKLKTREEFLKSLSEEELNKYGGIAKLGQPPANRYFKYKLLRDIVLHHGHCTSSAERESLILFVHLLKGKGRKMLKSA